MIGVFALLLAVACVNAQESKRLNQHNSLYSDLLRNDMASAKITYKQQACVMCQYYVQKVVYYMMQKPGIGPGEWDSNNKTLIELMVKTHKRNSAGVVKVQDMDYWDVFRSLITTIDKVEKDPKLHAKMLKARKSRDPIALQNKEDNTDSAPHLFRFSQVDAADKNKEVSGDGAKTKAQKKSSAAAEDNLPRFAEVSGPEEFSPLMDFPVTHRIAWMPGRIAAHNQLGYRPALDRYSPLGAALPNAQVAKDRDDWRRVVAASYRWLAQECSGRMGTKFVEWCLIVLQNFGVVAEAIHYRDRADEICYQINLCIASSYIMQAPHAPQLPTLLTGSGGGTGAGAGGGGAK